VTLYILDSDHLSLYQRGYEPIKAHLLSIPPDQIAITVVSVEELVRGRLAQIHKAVKPEKRTTAYFWLSQTFAFLCDFMIIPYDTQVEVQFQQLRGQKIRIGTQDLKIGAIALSHQAILVTRNRRDFGQIPHLIVEDWSGPVPRTN